MISRAFTLTLLICGFSIFCCAQTPNDTLPHADIAVQMTQPNVDTSVVQYGDSLWLSFAYENMGPDTLVAGDTLFFDIAGLLIYSRLNIDMNPGDIFTYTNVVYLYNPTDSQLAADICVIHLRQSDIQYNGGGTPQTTYVDTNFSNDTSCRYAILLGPDSVTGVHQVAVKKNNHLDLYPNPANNSVNFLLQPESGEHHFTLSVQDLSGRTVLTKSYRYLSAQKAPLRYELNVKSLYPGIYFVHVQTSKRHLISKLVIRR